MDSVEHIKVNRCSVCGHDIPPGKEIALGPGVAVCYHCESRRKKDEKALVEMGMRVLLQAKQFKKSSQGLGSGMAKRRMSKVSKIGSH